jgi:phospholipid transport system substrate-binding protein
MNNLVPRRVFLLPILLFISGFLSQAVLAEALESPSVTLERASNHIIEILTADHDLMRDEPERVYEIVDEYILPYLDEVTMAKLALGKSWKTASREQKQEFVLSFKSLLIRTYSRSLLEFSDQSIKFYPADVPPGTVRTTVKAEVILPGRPSVPLIYRMRVKNNAWKIYDIKVGGISLVTSYRGTFTQEVRKRGLDGLLKYMRNKKNDRRKLAINKEV